jgi:hypothetical protein
MLPKLTQGGLGGGGRVFIFSVFFLFFYLQRGARRPGALRQRVAHRQTAAARREAKLVPWRPRNATQGHVRRLGSWADLGLEKISGLRKLH